MQIISNMALLRGDIDSVFNSVAQNSKKTKDPSVYVLRNKSGTVSFCNFHSKIIHFYYEKQDSIGIRRDRPYWEACY